MKKRIDWKIFICSFAAVFLTAFIGSRFTITGEWYESVKPAITPPDYVFPIVWTILFVLIAFSLYFALIAAGRKRNFILIIFSANFLLNILWSYFFFYLQNPILAFFDIILLEASIVLLMISTYKKSKLSCLLLLPYALWVGFAFVLNYLIAF